MTEEVNSRTRQKAADRALQKLGEQLVTLSPEQLERIQMPDELRAAVRSARDMKRHGARRRQLQYIGALMRAIDPAPIQDALDNIRQGDHRKTMAFKRIEGWRDGLRAGDTGLIEDILERCPDASRQRLSQLARNARKEYESGGGIKASRHLFRYLRQIAGL